MNKLLAHKVRSNAIADQAMATLKAMSLHDPVAAVAASQEIREIIEHVLADANPPLRDQMLGLLLLIGFDAAGSSLFEDHEAAQSATGDAE